MREETDRPRSATGVSPARGKVVSAATSHKTHDVNASLPQVSAGTSGPDATERLLRLRPDWRADPLVQSLLKAQEGSRTLPLRLTAQTVVDALAAGQALKPEAAFAALPPPVLASRLTALFRQARHSQEESGAHTLFLALGSVHWVPPGHEGAPWQAPLILWPVTLLRASAAEGFTLQATEGCACLNPALTDRLREDFQCDLGVLDDGAPGLDVQGVWRRVRHALQALPGCSLSEESVLSVFALPQYLMSRSWMAQAQTWRRSPLVVHLLQAIDTPGGPYPYTSAAGSANALSAERQEVGSTPPLVCPLPADVSQRDALRAGARGEDFVLLGPPGTGKSQTLANLVAQGLAQGKRVLVVAEKKAALDVLHRRLQEAGVGDFCLPLQAQPLRWREVRAQLQRAWATQATLDEAEWLAQAQDWSQAHEAVTAYVTRMQLPRANGLSVAQALGWAMPGTPVPELALSLGDDVALHDEARLAQLRQAAAQLHAQAMVVGLPALSSGPLRAIHQTCWTQGWQHDLAGAVQALREAAQGLVSATRLLSVQLGLESLDLLNLDGQGRAGLSALAQGLLQAAGKSWAFCVGPESQRICEQLQQGAALLNQHEQLSAQLSQGWSAELRAQLQQALDLLDERRSLHEGLGQPVPVEQVEALTQGLRLLEQMRRLFEELSVSYSRGVVALDVQALHEEWERASAAVWPLSWNLQRKVRAQLEPVIDGRGEPQVGEDLAILVQLQSMRAEVEALSIDTELFPAWAGLRTKRETALLLLEANHALLAARQGKTFSLHGLGSVADGACGKRWALEVDQLRRLQALDRRLAECSPLNERSDGLWCGLQTDRQLLHEVLAFERGREDWRVRGSPAAPLDSLAQGRAGLRLQRDQQTLLARSALEEQLQAQGSLRSDTEGLWQGLDTDGDTLVQALAFQQSMQTHLQRLGLDEVGVRQVRESLQNALSQEAHDLAEGMTTGRACQLMVSRLPVLEAALQCFSTLARQPQEEGLRWANSPTQMLLTQAQELESASPALQAWCAWRDAQAAAESLGLKPLSEGLSRGDWPPEQTQAVFECNYARVWLAATVAADPVLHTFRSVEQERCLAAFLALDERFRQHTRNWLRARMCAGLPSLDHPPPGSDWATLQTVMALESPSQSLSQLWTLAPQAMARLAPCVLASPSALSPFLSSEGAPFDLVLFDEASQIPVWTALGLMARAQQVVVVGDSQQLPPSLAFTPEESGAEPQSILDLCLAARLPVRRLTHHYRSQHASLIAFSNQHFYAGALVTSPSAGTAESALSLTVVPGDGSTGEAGIPRAHVQMAEALVAEVLAQLRTPGFVDGGHSVGVLSFSRAQQRLMEDMLERAQREDPALAAAWNATKPEPLWVKCVDQAQGDERDFIYLALAFEPQERGAAKDDWGPLSRVGGERWLNVALTRARRGLRVFSSIGAAQIALTPGSASGVQALQHFLAFAEGRAVAAAEVKATPALAAAPPSFEGAVAQALTDKGWQLQARADATGEGAVLAVLHPDLSDAFLALLACDGCHAPALPAHGLEVVRVWALDWWRQPAETLERLHARLNALLAAGRVQRMAQAPQADLTPAQGASAQPAVV